MESSSAWKTEIKTGAILSRALGVTLDHYSMLVWAVLVHGMRNLLVTAAVLYFTFQYTYGPQLVLSVLIALSVFSYLHMPAICLNLVRKEQVSILSIPKLSILFNWFVASLFAILLVGTGLVLGLIPGFILAAFICFYGFAIVDGQGPIQSFRTSCLISKKAFWPVFLILCMIMLPSLLLNSPIFLGLDLALDIVATIALAIVYDTMRSGEKVKAHD